MVPQLLSKICGSIDRMGSNRRRNLSYIMRYTSFSGGLGRKISEPNSNKVEAHRDACQDLLDFHIMCSIMPLCQWKQNSVQF